LWTIEKSIFNQDIRKEYYFERNPKRDGLIVEKESVYYNRTKKFTGIVQLYLASKRTFLFTTIRGVGLSDNCGFLFATIHHWAMGCNIGFPSTTIARLKRHVLPKGAF